MNNDEPLTLQDVARRASEKNDGERGRGLGRRAEQRGLSLSYTTVDKMIEGTYKSRATRATLEALAVLSGLDREVVYRAAGRPLPLKPLAEDLPPEADSLDAHQRRVVIDTVRQFAKQNRALDELRTELAKEGRGHGIRPTQKSRREVGVPVEQAEDYDPESTEPITPPAASSDSP